jgi:RNA polymerase sigma-70 factor (ECF subfamily)
LSVAPSSGVKSHAAFAGDPDRWIIRKLGMLNLQTVRRGPLCGTRLYCAGTDRRIGPDVVTGKRVEYSSAGDETLVPLLHNQDVRALETIYARHSRAVYSLALKILADPTAAEEVVQECFLKLWRQPELFQPERGKLISWLLGVTHHRAIDLIRRRRLEQRYAADGEVDAPTGREADPEHLVWGRFQVEAVGRALATLPAHQRLALEVAYLGGLTQVEIATSLGEPLGTIKTRMRLAMQKLRAVPELAALAAESR